MSVELCVLHRTTVPIDRDSWQANLDALGLPVQLDARLDPSLARGFQPVALRGHSTGFELDRFPAADYAPAPDNGSEYDAACVFRWSGDTSEMAAALACAAALAALTQGIVYDPQEGETYSPEAAVDLAREGLGAL